MKNLLAIVPLALSLAFPVCAADKSKPEEPGITRQQADEILNELREIRKLLEKGAGPTATALIGSDGKVYMKLDGTQDSAARPRRSPLSSLPTTNAPSASASTR